MRLAARTMPENRADGIKMKRPIGCQDGHPFDSFNKDSAAVLARTQLTCIA